MTLHPGTILGPYEILAALGAGGMGEVYRARDTRLGRDVAIKTLPDSLAADHERLARFRREAETLAALNHPNIATIYGLERQEGQEGREGTDAHATTFIVMELVEGPTLADRVARGPMPLDEVLSLAKQLALALEAAHEKGIIHRDLKPANVKLTADGSIKLLDFGLAKALDVGSGGAGGLTASPTMSVMGTQAGVLLGTAAYMSPEQARGGTVDKRADIWAFGVVLFEMLTGRRMFGGDTISDTLAGVLREPIDLNRLPPEIPPAIRRLLGRCLERDPKRRLRDIGEARIAIDDHVANPRSEVAAAPRVWQARLGWQVAVPWVLVVLLLGSLAVLLPRLWRPNPAVVEQVATFDLELGGLTLQRAANFGGLVAISPDGRRIVIAAAPRDKGKQPGERNQQRLYQRALDSLDFKPIPGTEESALPFISADSEWVGFFVRGELKKVAFAGGVPIRICDVPDNVAGAAWMDDGTIVFASVGQLFQVPAGGGAPQPITTRRADSDGPNYGWPAAIPGRSAVLFTSRGTGNIGVLDLHSKHERLLADNGSYPRFVKGVIVYAQQAARRSGPTMSNLFSGGLLAIPFDTGRLVVTGPSISVLDGVRVFAGGAGNYDVSSNGTITQPIFGPGDDMVTFYSPSGRGLWTGSMDGSRPPERLTTSTARSQVPGSWSHDGKSLVFTDFKTSETGDILLVHRGERDSTPIVASSASERDPILSPDDRWLAYSSNESGRFEVYVRPFPGPGGRYVVSAGGGALPRWSKDGRRLYFAADESGLMSVDITVAPEFRASPPRPIRGTDSVIRLRGIKTGTLDSFVAQSYDIARDGRFLVTHNPDTEERPDTLHLILHFDQEIRRRMTPAKP